MQSLIQTESCIWQILVWRPTGNLQYITFSSWVYSTLSLQIISDVRSISKRINIIPWTKSVLCSSYAVDELMLHELLFCQWHVFPIQREFYFTVTMGIIHFSFGAHYDIWLLGRSESWNSHKLAQGPAYKTWIDSPTEKQAVCFQIIIFLVTNIWLWVNCYRN